MRDPYATLGVSKIASSSEIKSAFRRQAKASHPDAMVGRSQPDISFSEVLAAYEILGDAEKRRLFDDGMIDAQGRRLERRSMFRNFASGMPGFGFSRRDDADDGVGDSHPNKTRSDGPHDPVTETSRKASHEEIMERIFGEAVARTLNDDAPAMEDPPCSDDAGADVFSTGDIHIDVFVPLEAALRRTPMDIRLPDGRTVAVKVPSGIEREPVVRLSGQGETGLDGRTGDVLIRFRFKTHRHLRIDGLHLVCDLPVPLHQGIRGAKLPVETLDGRILVSIPPWSGSDRVLRIAGKGLPDHTGKRGDLFVRVRLMLPDRPNDELLAYAKTGATAS